MYLDMQHSASQAARSQRSIGRFYLGRNCTARLLVCVTVLGAQRWRLKIAEGIESLPLPPNAQQVVAGLTDWFP